MLYELGGFGQRPGGRSILYPDADGRNARETSLVPEPSPERAPVGYMEAAEAIGDRFQVLNLQAGFPLPISAAVPLSVIRERWTTEAGRVERRAFYLRMIALKKARTRRGTAAQVDPSTFTDNDYAGIVIWGLQRMFPDLGVETLYAAGENTLTVLAWARQQYPSAPRELVCDVILAMAGYFGISIPVLTDALATVPKDEEDKGSLAYKIAAGVMIGLILLSMMGMGRR